MPKKQKKAGRKRFTFFRKACIIEQNERKGTGERYADLGKIDDGRAYKKANRL